MIIKPKLVTVYHLCGGKEVPYKFQMYMDNAGDWRWRFIAPNNKKMADSVESYRSESSCMNAIEVIRRESDKSKITKLVPK